MRFVVMALANYCDAYKRLPPAVVTDAGGAPLASWRLAVLPVAHQWDWDAMYKVDLNLTWNSPPNASVTRRALSFYCFGRRASEARDASLDTSVFAVTGKGSAFWQPPNHLDDLPHDTVVLIEASETGIPWAAPGDLDVTQLEDLGTFHGNETDFHIAFADGSVWCLRADVPVETIRKFFLVATAREFDRDQEVGPYRI